MTLKKKKNSVKLIKFKFEHNDKLSYSNNYYTI